jgi:hypothetical protein
MTVLKISLGLFFLRAIVTTWHKHVIHAAVAISTLFGVAYFFFTVFQCGLFKNIVEFGWKRVTGKQCVSPKSAVGMGYAFTAITATTDLTFAILPLFVLSGMQMSKREKATVVLIFSLAAT